MIRYRESLVQLYVDALLVLGHRVHERGDTQEAVRIFRKALEIDPYREDIHRALLTCYAESGQRGLVLKHADKLTAFLKADLGLSPSLETVVLVQNLLR